MEGAGCFLISWFLDRSQASEKGRPGVRKAIIRRTPVRRVEIPLTSSSSSVETKGAKGDNSQGGYRYTLIWRDGT